MVGWICRYHMLDETNHVPVEAVTKENDGEPVLKALQDLIADDAKAQAIGKAAQHLALEVLHPDNVDRQALDSAPLIPLLFASSHCGNKIFPASDVYNRDAHHESLAMFSASQRGPVSHSCSQEDAELEVQLCNTQSYECWKAVLNQAR